MQQRNVVLVESDRAMEEMVQVAVGQLDGANVLVAETIDQAESLIRDLLPALVVVDDDSPTDSGLRLIRSLKPTMETREIPIVVLCSNSDTGRDLVSQGAEAFLPKPFDVADLMDLIQYYTQSVPPRPGGR